MTSLLLNGSSDAIKTPATESVTVTHFSEKRGTMEKISVPSTNIFNAEFKTDKNKGNDTTFTVKSSTNPFLNMSPTSTATQAVTLNVTSTNPFHITASPTSTTNSSFHDTRSVQSDGNNLPSATEAALDSLILLAATNPFSSSITKDEIDNRHIETKKPDHSSEKETKKNYAINNINNNNNENDRNNSSNNNKNLNETFTKIKQEVNDFVFFFLIIFFLFFSF